MLTKEVRYSSLPSCALVTCLGGSPHVGIEQEPEKEIGSKEKTQNGIIRSRSTSQDLSPNLYGKPVLGKHDL